MHMPEDYTYTVHTSVISRVELKQISESLGYPFEMYYPDSDPEPFRIVAIYYKHLWNTF